jgi:1-phosphatidylinositol-4-phosphate 5-kinase
MFAAAGQSMFYWCWVSIQREVPDEHSSIAKPYTFALVSLFLYYFWHFAFLIFSVCVLIAAAVILRGHLSTASSEIRKFVLKQNAAFVLVLGIEAFLIIPLWIAQLIITATLEHEVGKKCTRFQNELAIYTYYFWNVDLILAIVFAIVHSSRGTLDFVVWFITFCIGRSDVKDLQYRLKKKFFKNSDDLIQPHRRSPLIGKKDGAVNRALRRNAIYCINIGILDAVKLYMDQQGRTGRVGSVREEFVAAAMMQLDEERQEERTAELYRNNPNYREQSLREIQFPAQSALRISGFSFVDLEPSVFSLLRNCYGIDPRVYRGSFKIKNAADIESSGMLEKFTEGKSGSFFYFTRDFKYIVKTVTDEEEKFLQKIAYQYYNHMKNNPNSLIVRFFGMHKVRLAKEQRYITVVVMDNIFYNTEQFKMNERYDLKGSRVGRRSVKKTSKIRREYKGTLKDLDLGDKKIHVGADSKAQLLGQLRRDVEFLIQCKIMDYSMLLGIHNHSGAERTNRSVVREGSVRGRAGDDFVDVEIRNGSTAGASRTGTGSSSMKSFRDRISSIKSSGYNTRSNTRTSTGDSTTESTRPLVIDEEGDIVESQFHPREEHIAWFREDYGGLRSNSPLHPLYKEELQYRGHSVYFDNEQDATDVAPATYYFGIIDILQQYNWRKKAEHHWKTKATCKDQHGISCVNEREYGERFLNFMDEIFM